MGRRRQVFMEAIFAFHTGKAIVQIAAIKITVNDLLEIGTEESVGPLKPFLIDLEKGFQMIFNTAIIIGSLWIAGLINDDRGGHDSSPPRETGRLF